MEASDTERKYLALLESVFADRDFLRDVILSHEYDILALFNIPINRNHPHAYIFYEYRTSSDSIGLSRVYYYSILSDISMLLQQLEEDSSKVYDILNFLQIYRNDVNDIIVYRTVHNTLVRESDREEASDLVNHIWNQIIEDAASAGYEFRYFTFFKSDHPLVRINKENIKVTPEIYEGGSTLVDMELYESIIKNISDGTLNSSDINVGLDLTRTDQRGIRYKLHPVLRRQGLGWRKRDLMEAIKATGLTDVITVPDPRSKMKTKLLERVHSDREDYYDHLWYDIVELSNMGITEEGRRTTLLAEELGRKTRYYTGTFPGFGKNPYMPKVYYEALYRKLFTTLINVDWGRVCSQNLIGTEKLRNVAISDFHFDEYLVKRFEYKDLCNILQEESKRRRQLKDELKEIIPEARDVIYYRPGGRIMRGAETIGMFKSEVKEPRDEKETSLDRLIQMCSDPDLTKEQIFELAQEMDLEILLSRLPMAAPTKDDYCGVLRNYLEQIQRKDNL